MKLQDMADSDVISSDAAPAGVLNDAPVMEDFSISVNGILQLLQNLKPGKVAWPDRHKNLKELREEIEPIIQVIFEQSVKTGKLLSDWCKAQVTPIFKKGDKSSATKLQSYFPDLHTHTSIYWPHIWLSTLTSMTFCTIYNMALGEKILSRCSLPCWSRTLQEMWVQVGKLIWYCWIFQRPK